MALRSGGGRREFLETYDDRRREFETRHPDLRTFRLVALAVCAFVGLGVILLFVPQSPVRSPILITAPMVAVAFVFLTYGLIRWLEEHVMGQIALAVGLAGPVVVLVVIADCAQGLAGCLWIPSIAIGGLSWLVAWLLVGLVVDYYAWVRGDAGADLSPPRWPPR